MTVDQMVQYLRMNVSIQDPNGTVQDSAYLNMTDEDIALYMSIVLTRNYPDIPSLDYLPTEYVYPVILLSKKELFHALAVKEAPLYDIGADNNNYLKRSQRFEHYMKLIAQVDKEYEDYLENGGAGANTLTSFDVLLSDRYATKRNYEKGAIPALALYIGAVAETSIELSWKVKLSRFKEYKVYISKSKIVDLFNVSQPLSPDSQEVITIRNVHQTSCRIEGLLPDTDYYVAVSASEMSSLTAYAEKSFKTLSPIVVKVGDVNG